MDRIYVEKKDRYYLFFDPESLKWIIGDENLFQLYENKKGELYELFNNDTNWDGVGYIENNENRITAVSILPTLACNLSCIHCFYSSSPSNTFSGLNKDYIYKIIKFINDNKIESVTIAGGEPLIWEGIVLLMQNLLYKTKVRIFLLSNGLIINKIFDLLNKFRERIHVQISVDSASENTYKIVRGGNFKILIRNIKELLNSRIKLDLSYTIHQFNKNEVIKFIKLSEELGVSSLHFPILELYGRARDGNIKANDFDIINYYLFFIYYSFHIRKLKIYFVEEIKHRLIHRLKRTSCSAAKTQISIGPDGGIYPCSELLNNKFKITDIENYTQIEKVLKDFRNKTGLGLPIVDQICSNCPIRYICGGGCRAVDLLMGKSITEAKQNPLTCDILLKSVFTVIWELVNKKISPPIPLEQLYTQTVMQLIEDYHNA